MLMRRWLVLCCVLGSLPGWAAEIPLDLDSVLKPRQPATAVFDGRILQVAASGTLRAWRIADLQQDPEFVRALNSHEMMLLAADATTLYGSDLKEVFRWNAAEKSWGVVGSVAKVDKDPIQQLVATDVGPVLFREMTVEVVVGKRLIKIPPPKNEKGPVRVRALALHVVGSQLWFGTGYGEWGGELVGVNLKTGAWSRYWDDLHYVTGITHDSAGRLWVGWSMSHFVSDMMLRSHGPDAKVTQAFPQQKDRYLQQLAWDATTQRLYCVDQLNLAWLKKGVVSELAPLGDLPYGEEPNAVGVAPGVSDLMALGEGRVLIVPPRGRPRVFANGRVTVLSL
ncbi:hypothetical protein [Myxococcus stipitatus]|uniref:hypothetical protein n=1 Tax=Myxococcus stipitatus TaxID=83455 RepID=UPI0030D209C2